MKANELRIGNLVKLNGEIVKIEQITKKKIGYHKEPRENVMHYAKLCEVEPIELTEDVMYMVKCKDRWEEDDDIIHEIAPAFYVQTRGDNGKCRRVWKISIGILDAFYLHQLQNWYYMVYNKELEVEL